MVSKALRSVVPQPSSMARMRLRATSKATSEAGGSGAGGVAGAGDGTVMSAALVREGDACMVVLQKK